MKTFSSKKITLTALAIALVCVTTAYTHIPIPLGYMHLGNICILLCSFLFPAEIGLLAGGVGSALADLLTGFPQWILPTLLIKSLMGYAISKIAHDKNGCARMLTVRTALAAVAGIAIMIVGYFIAGSILYGSVATGLTQVPGLSFEGVLGIAGFYLIGIALEKAKIQRYLSFETRK